KIHVGIIGFGTVGSGTAEVLLAQAATLSKKTNLVIILKTVADINISSLPEQFNNCTLTRNADDIFNDPEIDIVVELIGGIEPAKTFILKAITAGKHVVSANKALFSTHGREIFEAASAKGVEVGFEASVGGGIPVIKALKEGLAANTILSIMGIMNGTANYILSQMTDHALAFDTVLKDAQAKGYAEADPTYDVEGIDTAHKLVILMVMAYGINISLNDVTIEGISRIKPIDIEFARQFGCRIKLLAISRNHGNHIEARVHPTMVPDDHLLANINGAMNGINFNGDMVGNVLLYGQGAGKLPTGSAVVADIVDIARNIAFDCVGRVPSLSFLPAEIKNCTITPMEKISCPYYFRISAVDKPGVLAAIAGILGKNAISIESVIQKKRQDIGPVPIVIRTHTAQEKAVSAALDEIDSLDIITEKTVKIRILE
ncbi:MAG: homoserine dehydrogenase, partial [Proteobacteria bacterium]|nr:homoserine dehydrogenase [Desulfobulbaceae bacterium]MBU4152797.1 homoserine dehydrogenase [Pseudomonadota bacterium]